MSYQPLARKYRPLTFEDLVGQDSVAKALANAIKLGREPHGVIFSGVRGIGKTTTARLYAKALNCDNGPTPSPCDQCPSCLAINKGSHEDVLEIDGASNTGVADVRALQETVEYSPQRSRFKVYIVDEVHMLSQAAFNALLKTLEEPPAHVVFVFATTELVKVPQTIVSRCQTFYLQKFTLATIRARLIDILNREQIEFEDAAVTIVAKEGHGSMRDALTGLDQAIAIGEGRVTVAAMASIISDLSSTPFLDLIDALIARNAQAALKVIDDWDQLGAEFDKVVERLATLVRHAFVVRDLGAESLDVGLLGLDDEEVNRLIAIGETAAAFDLNRLFRTLVKCHGEMSGAVIDRFILENYLFEWCFDPGLPDLDALISGKGVVNRPTAGTGMVQQAGVQNATPQAVPQAQTQAQPIAPEQRQSVTEKFAKLKSEIGGPKPAAKPAPKQPEPTNVPLETQAAPEQKVGFPATWRDLVNTWKQKKPLQARKLEEVRPLKFGPDELILAVDPDSFASKVLLTEGEQRSIMNEFEQLFGFRGRLIFKEADLKRSGAEATPVEASASPETPAPVQMPEPVQPAAPIQRPMPMEAAPAPKPVVNQPAAPAPQQAEPIDHLDTGPQMQGAQAQPPQMQRNPAAKAGVPETILEVKSREAVARHQKLEAEAREAPLTQEVLAVLGGSVKDVKVREGGLNADT